MLIDTIDIGLLRAFQLVARNGNLRSAAAVLGRSIPAVSMKIRRLEKDLNVELFQRLPNKMMLTAAGSRLLHDLDHIFEAAEQALKTLSLPVLHGRLAVAVGSDHSHFFAGQIGRFLDKHPNVEFSLQVFRAAEALSALQQGDVDIAIGIFSTLPRTMERAVIAESGLAVLCPAKHALSRKKSIALNDLSRQRLVLPARRADTRKLIDRAFKSYGAHPDKIIEVTNCSTARSFVEHGLGIAIVHSLCAERDSAATVKHFNLSPNLGTIQLCAVYLKGGQAKSIIINGLINELRSSP